MSINGLDKLQANLVDTKRIKAAQMVVKYHGAELTKIMQRKALFKGHMGYKPGVKGKVFIKPTGTTRRSILLDYQPTVRGARAVVRPYTHYAAYLELGTRYMVAQPFVKPAINEVEAKFIDDMKRLGYEGGAV